MRNPKLYVSGKRSIDVPGAVAFQLFVFLVFDVSSILVSEAKSYAILGILSDQIDKNDAVHEHLPVYKASLKNAFIDLIDRR